MLSCTNAWKPIAATINHQGKLKYPQTDKQTDSFLQPSTCLQILPIKGQRAADQRVEDDSQTPDVYLRPVILLSLEKLRRSIGRWATERVQLVAQGELIAEAEVGNLDVGIGIQQEVLCLTHTSIHAEEEAEMDSRMERTRKNRKDGWERKESTMRIKLYWIQRVQTRRGKLHLCVIH